MPMQFGRSVFPERPCKHTMPLELVSRTGNASWHASIERERAARLQLKKSCRPLPSIARVPEVASGTWSSFSSSLPSSIGSSPCSPCSRLGSTSAGLLEEPRVEPSKGAPTMWAGLVLQDHPKLQSYVSNSRPHASRGTQSQGETLTSTFNLTKPWDTSRRPATVGTVDALASWATTQLRPGQYHGSCPNHMASYPETGEWML
mmetsp:Transcript_18961/g.39117  ORF Transcript_18961/g.39117 Transcript_18961/m.39117 type:complete len:203 (+) Transcript_18961:18-626(+)